MNPRQAKQAHARYLKKRLRKELIRTIEGCHTEPLRHWVNFSFQPALDELNRKGPAINRLRGACVFLQIDGFGGWTDIKPKGLGDDLHRVCKTVYETFPL